MTSIVTRLGVALLAGVIPFASTGCKDKQKSSQSEAVQEEKLFKARHISEVFQYKKDYNTQKIFISAEKNQKKMIEGLLSLGIKKDDLESINDWKSTFNHRVLIHEQKEIKISSTPKTQAENDKCTLVKNSILVTPFVVNPFWEVDEYDYDDTKFVLLPRQSQSLQKRMPLSLTLLSDEYKFNPNSLRLTLYLYQPEGKNLFEIKEGLQLTVTENKGKCRTFNFIIPMENIPMTINTGYDPKDLMYLVGLDKVKVTEGAFSVELVER